MEAYKSFAIVYDMFMDNIPYPLWGDYVESLLKEYQINDGLILELGCGTGNITELLSNKGYEMIGIDNSEDMLMRAREKSEEKGLDILYLYQDMIDFELYGTVKAVVSICDSMNYILNKEDLLEVFKKVNNYLDPNGLFIFDLNTIYKYEYLLGDQTIAENRDEHSFIWDNYYDEAERINEYQLSLFIKDSECEETNIYHKYEEEHYQKAYELEEIKALLAESGLVFLHAYDAFTKDKPREDSERIYIIAKESGK